MHGLPQWPTLDISLVESLHHHAGSTTHCPMHHSSIGAILALDVHTWSQGDGVEPEVAVVAVAWVVVKIDTVAVGKGLGIHLGQHAMVGQVLIEHRHLAAPYTCTNVAHAVVVAYVDVLIVGIALTGLGGIIHDLVFGRHIGTHQCATTRGGDHFVAVERHDAKLPERAHHLAVEP